MRGKVWEPDQIKLNQKSNGTADKGLVGTKEPEDQIKLNQESNGTADKGLVGTRGSDETKPSVK